MCVEKNSTEKICIKNFFGPSYAQIKLTEIKLKLV